MSGPITLLLVASAHAQAPPPIVNGETTSDWPAVGMLAAYDDSSGGASVYCSASLVEDRAVVTAAHCVEAGQTYEEWGYDTVFVVGASIADAEDWVRVDAWVEHPDYVFTTSSVSADVGVALLADTLQVDVEPIPLRTASLGTAWYDEDLTLVGYGITRDNAEDAGTKRTATLPVYTLDSDFVYAIDEDPDGSNACQGDSGGAALRRSGDGWELVGVLSFVFAWHDTATSCVGGGVGATRMDVFGEWVALEAGFEDDDGGGGGLVNDGGGSGGGGDNPLIGGRGEGCAAGPALAGPLAGLLALLGLGRRRR